MDALSTQQPYGDRSCKSMKRRRHKKIKKKTADGNEQNSEASDSVLNEKFIANISTGNSLVTESVTTPMVELQAEVPGLKENISVSNAGKKKRKKKKKKKTGRTLNDAELLSVESRGQSQLLNCSKASEEMVDDKAVPNLPNENVLVSESNANVPSTRKRKRKSNKKSNSMDEPGRSTQIEYGPSFGPNSESLSPNLNLIPSIRRKLLVLDVSGLLADIVQPVPKRRGGYTKLHGRAIFWRPYCKDFLQFCFQNFDVGIWSSRSWKVVTEIVRLLLGRLRAKLKIVWDRSHCTKTKFNTLDNKHKPIVCKELRKIWEINDPKMPWKKGDYDESNTLLVDDSPYKALLNPLHTAVFPHTYRYADKNDTSLGPNGDLQNYLKGLLSSDNVQRYVKEHPFGQKAITEEHESWETYAQVIRSKSNPNEQ